MSVAAHPEAQHDGSILRRGFNVTLYGLGLASSYLRTPNNTALSARSNLSFAVGIGKALPLCFGTLLAATCASLSAFVLVLLRYIQPSLLPFLHIDGLASASSHVTMFSTSRVMFQVMPLKPVGVAPDAFVEAVPFGEMTPGGATTVTLALGLKRSGCPDIFAMRRATNVGPATGRNRTTSSEASISGVHHHVPLYGLLMLLLLLLLLLLAASSPLLPASLPPGVAPVAPPSPSSPPVSPDPAAAAKVVAKV
jgi:hypothetical protein